jgi:hypothetical protein
MEKPARKVALLAADGIKAEPVAMLLSALCAAGAVPSLIGSRLEDTPLGILREQCHPDITKILRQSNWSICDAQ